MQIRNYLYETKDEALNSTVSLNVLAEEMKKIESLSYRYDDVKSKINDRQRTGVSLCDYSTTYNNVTD